MPRPVGHVLPGRVVPPIRARLAGATAVMDVQVVFGAPAAPPVPWREQLTGMLVDDYVVLAGRPVPSDTLVGVSIPTLGSANGAAFSVLPLPNSIDTGATARFLPDRSAYDGWIWTSVDGGYHLGVYGSGDPPALGPQMHYLRDGSFVNAPVLSFRDAPLCGDVTMTSPTGSSAWLVAGFFHPSPQGVYVVLDTGTVQLRWRAGQLEIVDHSGNLLGRTPQIGFGGPLVAGVKLVDPHVSVIGYGPDGLYSVTVTAPGLAVAPANPTSLQLGPSAVMDLLEADYWDQPPASLRGVAAMLGAVYGGTP